MIHRRPVVKVDKLTMDVMERYGSTLEAANENGVPQPSVYCEAELKHVPHRRFFFRFADEYSSTESFDGKRNRPVVIKDLKWHKEVAYYDVVQAAKSINYSACSIRKAIFTSNLLGKRYKAEWLR